MKYSGIGGQAVMEGVMMRNGDQYAVAVRKPDHEIEVAVFDYKLGKSAESIRKLPIIRGVFSFVDSLYLGMSTLMFSSSFFEEEDDKEDAEHANGGKELTVEELRKKEEKDAKAEKLMMTGTLIFSVVLALGIFFVVPYILSEFLHKVIASDFLVTFLEGVIRLLIFIIYISAISFMPDIKRTFMYHGAEHKCINCIEHGLELNVENVRKSSKEHKRCGTSFLLIVMIISIFFFMFIRVDSPVLKLLLRLLLIPVIAGVSYEFLRAAGRYDNALMNVLSKPGLWMQGLTTAEPDDEMIEVGIASVNAVFDWKKWQEENGPL